MCGERRKSEASLKQPTPQPKEKEPADHPSIHTNQNAHTQKQAFLLFLFGCVYAVQSHPSAFFLHHTPTKPTQAWPPLWTSHGLLSSQRATSKTNQNLRETHERPPSLPNAHGGRRPCLSTPHKRPPKAFPKRSAERSEGAKGGDIALGRYHRPLWGTTLHERPNLGHSPGSGEGKASATNPPTHPPTPSPTPPCCA